MKRHRRKSAAFAAALVAVLLAYAPAAPANPLLSGYGGPGQGNQAILGSALLNAPRGGSGGGSGGAGGGTGGGAAGVGAATSPQSGSASGGSVASGSRPHRHATRKNPAKTGSSSATSPAPDKVNPTLSRSSAVSTDVLGLSAADLAFILLALVVLAAVAAVTMWLARHSQGEQRVS